MTVLIVPHDPNWARAFSNEAAAIVNCVQDVGLKLHHIGSTAVHGLLAKPIIDLLGEVKDAASLDRLVGIEGLGYEAMGAFGIEGRRYFRKINAAGKRTHHLHIFEHGSPNVERHIAFRDYLRAHDDIAAQYGALKVQLTSEKVPEWDGYVDGKSPFVRRVERDALAWYRNVNGSSSQ